MHGLKKSAAAEARKSAETQKKIATYRTALHAVCEKKRAHVYDDEGLAQCAAALGVCPDSNILWNYRKEALLARAGDTAEAPEPCVFADDVVAAEMKLLERSIQLFPKSYWIWHHRQWLTAHARSVDWARELRLCDMLLKADPRNFHGWRYRRFVTAHMERSDEEELAYTEQKINENFSNYSAWHQRSLLLLRMHPEPADLANALRSDIELVRNAMYVEPKDQSAWVYYDWLMLHLLECLNEDDKRALLEEEIRQCDELLSMEPDCVLALLTKMRLCVLHNHGAATPESRALLERLLVLDPARTGYYQHLLAAQ